MRSDSMLHLPAPIGPKTPGTQAQRDARRADRSAFVVQGPGRAIGSTRSGQSGTDAPGAWENQAACRTVEVALQTLARVDRTWADASRPGPAPGDGRTDPRRAAEEVLDDSARREVERMLAQARGYAAAIERSRRQLQSTMDMVLDLIHIEAARPDSGANASRG